MAVPVDVIPRRPTLLFIVVLSLLFILMSLSSRTRYVGETRTMFERSVMTIFSPVPKTVNWIGQTTDDIYHGYLDMRRSVAENIEYGLKVRHVPKAERKAKLQAKVDQLNTKLQEKLEHAKQRSEQIKSETEAKVQALQKKAAKAQGDAKKSIENRVDQIKQQYEQSVSHIKSMAA